MSDSKGKRVSRESPDFGDSAAVAAETAIAQAPEASDAAATVLPAAPPISAADAACAAFLEAQLALSCSLRESSDEWAEMARAGMAAGADAASGLLAAKTFADLADVQTALVRRALDAAIAGTARLSHIGIRTAGEAARPILLGLSRMSPPAAIG
jgi:hypothetical protein